MTCISSCNVSSHDITSVVVESHAVHDDMTEVRKFIASWRIVHGKEKVMMVELLSKIPSKPGLHQVGFLEVMGPYPLENMMKPCTSSSPLKMVSKCLQAGLIK